MEREWPAAALVVPGSDREELADRARASTVAVGQHLDGELERGGVHRDGVERRRGEHAGVPAELGEQRVPRAVPVGAVQVVARRCRACDPDGRADRGVRGPRRSRRAGDRAPTTWVARTPSRDGSPHEAMTSRSGSVESSSRTPEAARTVRAASTIGSAAGSAWKATRKTRTTGEPCRVARARGRRAGPRRRARDDVARSSARSRRRPRVRAARASARRHRSRARGCWSRAYACSRSTSRVPSVSRSSAIRPGWSAMTTPGEVPTCRLAPSRRSSGAPGRRAGRKVMATA